MRKTYKKLPYTQEFGPLLTCEQLPGLLAVVVLEGQVAHPSQGGLSLGYRCCPGSERQESWDYRTPRFLRSCPGFPSLVG